MGRCRRPSTEHERSTCTTNHPGSHRREHRVTRQQTTPSRPSDLLRYGRPPLLIAPARCSSKPASLREPSSSDPPSSVGVRPMTTLAAFCSVFLVAPGWLGPRSNGGRVDWEAPLPAPHGSGRADFPHRIRLLVTWFRYVTTRHGRMRGSGSGYRPRSCCIRSQDTVDFCERRLNHFCHARAVWYRNARSDRRLPMTP